MIDKIIAQARTGEIGDGKIFGKYLDLYICLIQKEVEYDMGRFLL